jgi:hypothetical protein
VESGDGEPSVPHRDVGGVVGNQPPLGGRAGSVLAERVAVERSAELELPLPDVAVDSLVGVCSGGHAPESAAGEHCG